MFVPTVVPVPQPSTGPRTDARPGATTPPNAIAVSLGSGRIQVWAAGRGGLGCPSAGTAGTSRVPVRRGRVVDGPGCTGVLSQLIRQYRDPIPAGPVVVVCRPVQTTTTEQHALGQVVEAVFAPSRVLFIDTVRAAAIGAGAATGGLLVVDIGAEISEAAILRDGRVTAARRTDIGTRDLTHGAPTEMLSHAVARMIKELCGDAATRAVVPTALRRGLLVVGDGAGTPDLIAQIAANLRIPVQAASAPWTAALTGAGLAALSAARHPSTR
ncbi:rod shape-determining protein [Plantactinospora sp. S1510]|uniref:Rod shape-determining protein n=1 Tax=Plantactinospora alkalitolerans TaxID=2789879 RepID=A0ABS0GR68_9ACTN|nr:rod shape-determining protein [Plantactinospora alkalitolerans]MBF9128397.1 rod shape-determining protein [Plantactinospora alkalitolerans]